MLVGTNARQVRSSAHKARNRIAAMPYANWRDSLKQIISLCALGIVALTSAAAAEPVKLSGAVADVFGPRFVLETPTGKILVDVGPKGMAKLGLKPGQKIDVEGDRRANELRAQRVTLSDGHTFTTGKSGRTSQTWREWITGKPAPGAGLAFGPAEAKTFATKAGYALNSEPETMKGHFKVAATKDGKNVDLHVFKDGRLEPLPMFGMVEAKKLAADKGYQLTTDPVATNQHFRVSATKAGKPFEIDLHRNGSIVERSVFGAVDAQKLVSDGGYVMVGELKAVDEHFELLGKKDGKFYELHARRGGKLIRHRTVEANDPKWGSLVR